MPCSSIKNSELTPCIRPDALPLPVPSMVAHLPSLRKNLFVTPAKGAGTKPGIPGKSAVAP